VIKPPPLPPNAALRWAVVEREIARLAPKSILEIGCGQGAFGARLAGQVAEYTAVEPDPTSYAVARQRIEGAGGTVLNATSEVIEAGREFDVVCAFEVLEHLADDVAATTDWLKFVRPGGHLVISMPAFQERFNNWDTLVGHYRRYSPDAAETVLLAAGFTEVGSTVYGWPLGYALEAVRHRVAARDGAVDPEGVPSSMQDRTARSGRILKPKALTGSVATLGVAPFIALQRLRSDRGTGLVTVAQRPVA
jgi:SAM-dependent methyltransferase